MQHLSHGSRRHILISENFRGCQDRVGSSRCIELNHMLHRLCGPRRIHLSLTLRPYSQGGRKRVSSGKSHASRAQPQKSTSFTAWTTRYLILFAPHAFAPGRQSSSRAAFATGIPQISTHFTATRWRFYPPLRDSSLPVSNAVRG